MEKELLELNEFMEFLCDPDDPDDMLNGVVILLFEEPFTIMFMLLMTSEVPLLPLDEEKEDDIPVEKIPESILERFLCSSNDEFIFPHCAAICCIGSIAVCMAAVAID